MGELLNAYRQRRRGNVSLGASRPRDANYRANKR